MSYSFLSSEQEPVFNSGVVKAFEYLSLGWQLIKDQYFLFVGMCLIIVVLVTCIPFTGIIYGAWMAGIYYALLGRMRGEPASFNAIGKGFGYFSQGFVIALLSGLPFALFWQESFTTFRRLTRRMGRRFRRVQSLFLDTPRVYSNDPPR